MKKPRGFPLWLSVSTSDIPLVSPAELLRGQRTGIRRFASTSMTSDFRSAFMVPSSDMASAEGLLGGPSPLKAPAIEVVDLSSETEATAEVKHDDNLEDQWTDEEDPEDQWSLYEDALQGMMDGDPSEVRAFPPCP